MSKLPMNKRLWLFTSMFLVLSACAGSGPELEPADKTSQETMQALADKTLSKMQVVFPPDPELLPGQNRLVFAVLDAGGQLIRDKKLVLYYAKSENDSAKGPITVTFEDDGLGDRSFYKAKVDFPSVGKWLVLVREDAPGKVEGAGTQMEVVATSKVVREGDKAISVKTPTTNDHLGLQDICTGEPEDPMHYISLDEALKNGKPTVLVFATPKLCASRVCGPVVDQVLRVYNDLKEKVNFIHVEVFSDTTGKEFTSAMKEWKLETEPWTFIIDDHGIVQGRLEGPVTTGELKAALGGLF